MKNNNNRVIDRMAWRSLHSNKKRNGVLILAVFLSAFLLFTVLTVGKTWFQMQSITEIRLTGLDSDAYLYGGFTKEQKKVCEQNPDISATAISAIAGWAVKTEADDTIDVIFLWEDDVYWKDLGKPARKWVKGNYPQKENEVMVTKAALEACGLGTLDVGDTFEMTYADDYGEYTKEFTISGMWGEYRNRREFLVSKAFWEQSEMRFEDYGRGFIHLKYKTAFITDKMKETLERDLQLNKRQRLYFTGIEMQSLLWLLTGMAGLVAVTCLVAFLLIYNIMYLSVSGNTRYYGLLCTIGMTGRQINRFVKQQMLFIAVIGIGGGLFFGSLASFVLVPLIVRNLGVQEGDIPVSIHPLIFFICIFVAGITVFLGSRKPARLAAGISPIEALGYRPVSGKKRAHRLSDGKRKYKFWKRSLLWRMAAEQFGMDKKKTAMAVGALGICLSFFLCAVTLTESQGPRKLVSNYMDLDMVIRDDTMARTEKGKWKRVITPSFLDSLQNSRGIKEFHVIQNEQIVIPWGDDWLEEFMKDLYGLFDFEKSYSDMKKEYQKHPENYYSFLEGIDRSEFRQLNAMLDVPANEEEFLSGRTCILYDPGLATKNEEDSGIAIKNEKLAGQTVSYYLSGQKGKKFQMKIAGITGDSYYGWVFGQPPKLLVSDSFLQRIVKEPFVSRVGIRYKEEYDEVTENAIKGLMENSKRNRDFSYDSKIEELKVVEDAQGNTMGVGIGVAAVLGFIGMMNYINTSVGNIQSRRLSLSVLESIGMTGKQLKRMLVYEGLLFAAGSIAVTITAGLAVAYYLYQAVNYRGIPFEVPVTPMLLAFLLVIAVCIIVPVAAYRNIERKEAVIERIRSF